MSVVEIAKETLNGVKQLSEKKYAINRIDKAMRMIAAIILISIFMNEELNLGIPFSKVSLNLWDESLRDGLKSNIYKVCTFWLVYELIISNVLRWLCIYFDKTEGVESLPVLFTLNDLVDFVCSLYFFAYATNRLIELNNTVSNDDMRMSIIAGVYLAIEFINWLHIKNRNNWYYIHRKYTYYFDMNNKRIPQNANVIYRGKLYRVYLGDVVGTNRDSHKKEWRLSSWDNRDSISLEEAVKDREGNLTIETSKYWYDKNE